MKGKTAPMMMSSDVRRRIDQSPAQFSGAKFMEVFKVPNRRKWIARRPGKLLQMGTGTGNNLVIDNWAMGYEVYSLDGSQSAVESGKTRFKDKGSEHQEWKFGAVSRIDFPDLYFEAVVYQGTIHQNTFDIIRKCVMEFKRVLKPGGIFLCSLTSENRVQFGKGTVIGNEGFENPDLDRVRHFFSQVQIFELFRGFNFFGSYVTPSQNRSNNWAVTVVLEFGG